MKAYEVNTGGNCRALRIDLFGPLYLLVTHKNGHGLPVDGEVAFVSMGSQEESTGTLVLVWRDAYVERDPSRILRVRRIAMLYVAGLMRDLPDWQINAIAKRRATPADFTDGNAYMQDALEQTLGRPMWRDDDVEGGHCTEQEAEDDYALWNDAYDHAICNLFPTLF